MGASIFWYANDAPSNFSNVSHNSTRAVHKGKKSFNIIAYAEECYFHFRMSSESFDEGTIERGAGGAYGLQLIINTVKFMQFHAQPSILRIKCIFAA